MGNGIQTTYTQDFIAGFEGQKADLGLSSVSSKVAEGSAVNFGRAVIRGTADNQAKLPSGAGGDFIGVTMATTAWTADADDVHLYEQYREMNILDFGEIYVYTEQSVVPGDSVYFRHTAEASPLDVVGRFRKDDSTGNADLIEGATFETTTAAGGFAKIKLTGTMTDSVILSETITAVTGAISLLTEITFIDTTAGAAALTLADGTAGQRKLIKMTVDGGDAVITPANFGDGSTITFADANDSVELLFDGTDWQLLSNNGTAIA